MAKVNGGNGTPVVGGGEEEVEELLDSVGKLGVGPIGVVGAGEGCSTANRKRRQVELAGTRRGGRCGALGIQLGGCKASRDREEST
jgi:hypothetical protein